MVEVWLNMEGFTHKGMGWLFREGITMVRLAGIEGLVDVGLVVVVLM